MPLSGTEGGGGGGVRGGGRRPNVSRTVCRRNVSLAACLNCVVRVY